ncbi:hypothetical protein ACLB2K_064514 [Fragaria x ananassa]
MNASFSTSVNCSASISLSVHSSSSSNFQSNRKTSIDRLLRIVLLLLRIHHILELEPTVLLHLLNAPFPLRASQHENLRQVGTTRQLGCSLGTPASSGSASGREALTRLALVTVAASSFFRLAPFLIVKTTDPKHKCQFHNYYETNNSNELIEAHGEFEDVHNDLEETYVEEVVEQEDTLAEDVEMLEDNLTEDVTKLRETHKRRHI